MDFIESMQEVLTDRESLQELGITSKVMQLVISKEVKKLFSVKRVVKMASADSLNDSNEFSVEGVEGGNFSTGIDVDIVLSQVPSGDAKYSSFSFIHEGGEDKISFMQRTFLNIDTVTKSLLHRM